MKNINQKITTIILLIAICFIQIPVQAINEVSGLVVPIRFKYEVSSDSIEEGDAIPIEVVENVYLNNMILFRENGSGIAYVTSFKKSSFLGQGGKIEIRTGYLQDINGRRHNIILSSNAKGRGSLAPLVLSLATAGLAVNIWDAFSGTGNKASSILYGSAASLGALGLATMTGKEAKLSPGKVIFAHVD